MHLNQIHRPTRAAAIALSVITLCGAAFAEDGASNGRRQAANAPVLASNQYQQKYLVADRPGVAAVTDPNLVNPWGLSRSSGSPWWVSDNGTGLSTLYDGVGTIQSLVVTIPPSNPNTSSAGTPTGTVFNGTTDFAVAPGKPAVFLFVSEDGVISGEPNQRHRGCESEGTLRLQGRNHSHRQQPAQWNTQLSLCCRLPPGKD